MNRLFAPLKTRQAFLNLLATLLLAAGAWALYAGTISHSRDLPILSLCLGAGAFLTGGWLLKRGFVDKAALPKTGLEAWLVLLLLAAMLSVAFSDYPRFGLEKFAWYAGLSIFFYALLDLMEDARLRLRILQIVLFFTGLALFLTLMETYIHYLIWWSMAGSRSVMPPHPYRFVSVVVQSNMFMGLVNMCAPLALVLFLRTKSRASRFFLAFWLVLYLVNIPFSSSRGGWLGAAVAIFMLGLLWLADSGRWLRYGQWLRKYWAIGLAGTATCLAAGGLAIFKIYTVFAAANPSHGSGLNLNREWIWQIAWNIWKASPWTGSGLGSLGPQYTRAIQAYPDPWWPGYAHSQPLQILAEMGLAGFLPFIALTISVIALLVRGYFRAPASERMVSAAAIAGLSGLFVHGIFDDFSSLPVLVVAALILIAAVITAPGPLNRFRGVPLAWLGAAGLPVAAVAAFSLWSYAPFYSAAGRAPVADWGAAAIAADQSALRDSSMAHYQFQSAVAWAVDWQKTQDQGSLDRALSRLKKGLEKDPSYSLNWANLGILEWQAGRVEDAVKHLRMAEEMAPTEPNFPLNLGWVLEQLGREDEAVEQYRLALRMMPSSAGHPFWSMTSARMAAASGVQTPAESSAPYWKQARVAIAQGDFAAARLNLAKSYYFWEAPVPFGVTWVDLHRKSGNPDDARFYLEQLVSSLNNSYWTYTIGEVDYSGYVYRKDFGRFVVPGFLQITEDVGQFDALETLYQEQVGEKDCEEAARTWQVLQREIHAGELVPGGYPPAGQCP